VRRHYAIEFAAAVAGHPSGSRGLLAGHNSQTTHPSHKVEYYFCIVHFLFHVKKMFK
jgi:hypothetical protein